MIVFDRVRTILKVKMSDTIRDIKNMYGSETGVPANRQTLSMNGRILANNGIISAYNIHAGSQLRCSAYGVG